MNGFKATFSENRHRIRNIPFRRLVAGCWLLVAGFLFQVDRFGL